MIEIQSHAFCSDSPGADTLPKSWFHFPFQSNSPCHQVSLSTLSSHLKYKYISEQRRDTHTKRSEPQTQNSQHLTCYLQFQAQPPFQTVSLSSNSLSSRIASPTFRPLGAWGRLISGQMALPNQVQTGMLPTEATGAQNLRRG